MRFSLLCIVLLFLCVFMLNDAGAQDNLPLEITADGTLEWHRADRKMIARKNARATQGDNSITAQTLTAVYTDKSSKKFDIQKITAENNVTIISGDAIITGDHALYDLISAEARMTGKTLSMRASNARLFANDYFSYNTKSGRLSAVGTARLEQTNENGEVTTLRADRLDADLTTNAQDKRTLKQLKAQGSVTITTPTEIITGQNGVYNAVTQKAEISGHVVIKRGPNLLQGARADVDLQTNISRIHGDTSPSSHTRVRGVFYPGTE
jgi:lipopolysaccharide export system protein LptA